MAFVELAEQSVHAGEVSAGEIGELVPARRSTRLDEVSVHDESELEHVHARMVFERRAYAERVATAVELRVLSRAELSRVAEIDRRERIDVLYEQRAGELHVRRGRWDAPQWDPDGEGGHSVRAVVRSLEHYADAGGVAVGAFADERLVGIGVVVPHVRPDIAQLAFLHVSAPFRATGVGSLVADELERLARHAGDSEMVVSATPSENTVRFYLGRGFTTMSEPLAELAELEPDDIHLHKAL